MRCGGLDVDSTPAIIKAVVRALQASPDVSAIVSGRVYTDVPQGEDFPYLVVTLEAQPFAASDFSGQSHTIRLQAFSQKASAKEVTLLRKAAIEALDRQESSILLSEGTLVLSQFAATNTVFQEEDGKTWQAVGEIEMIVV